MRNFLTGLLCLFFCLLCHAEPPRIIRIELPGYRAELSERSLLTVRDAAGTLLFTERFFLHDKEKDDLASAALAASSLTADELRKTFTYTAEVPGRFRLVKQLAFAPNGFRVECILTVLGTEPLRSGELTLMLNAESFEGKSFEFNGGAEKGVLPKAGEALPAMPKPLKKAEIGGYKFSFNGPDVVLLDSRASGSRWSRSSFRLRDSRHNLRPGKEFRFLMSVQSPGTSTGALLEEMEVVAFTPVDLSSVCNMGFRENETPNDGKGGWTDEGPGGNDFRSFPVGPGQFAGVPFTVIDPAVNAGKSCIVLAGEPKKHLPHEVEIPVGRPAVSVYFLQACGWKDNGAVADYLVRYTDGTEEQIPLEYGKNICGWWDPVNTLESAVGWRGSTSLHSPVGINVFGWNNPHPEKTIGSILFRSRIRTCVPILAGITLSNQQVSLIRAEETERRTDTSGWISFIPDAYSAPVNALNISAGILRHAPAGKYGFVTAKNGRFEFANGERARFFGGALVGGACFPPTKEDADTLAASLAKLGCNIARLHMYDNTQFTDRGEPRINIFGEGAKSSELSPERMEAFDYLVAALKKRGIYIFLDLHGPRAFTEHDGVAAELRDKFGNSREKRGFYFDPATIKANRAFQKALLLHRNPFTGNRYVDEPAIAMVNITNENTLFLAGIWWRLEGSYAKQYAALWNRWLLDRYHSREALASAWGKLLQPGEDPAAGTVKIEQPVGASLGSWGGVDTPRLTDATRFAYELQTGFYRATRDYLRGLGLKVPIAGSQALFRNPPDLKSQAEMDFIDQHPYFFGRRPMSQAELPDFDTITQIALARVHGKPLTVTEWNYHNKDIFPWRSDAPLFVAAYAALQDMDCLIVHAYSHSYNKLSHILWNQNISSDPVFVGQWQTASNLFLRGDVSPAKEVRVASAYDRDSVFRRGEGSVQPGFSPFRHRLETVFDAPAGKSADQLPPEGPVVTSDTGELVWRRKDGILFINTPKSQAMIGRLDRAADGSCENLAFEAVTPLVNSLSVTALDDRALAASKHMLLTVCGRCENTGMVWDASGFKALKRGTGPVLIEPVRGKVTLRGLAAPETLQVYPLRPDGSRLDAVPVERDGGQLRFSLGAPTIYYEITAE